MYDILCYLSPNGCLRMVPMIQGRIQRRTYSILSPQHASTPIHAVVSAVSSISFTICPNSYNFSAIIVEPLLFIYILYIMFQQSCVDVVRGTLLPLYPYAPILSHCVRYMVRRVFLCWLLCNRLLRSHRTQHTHTGNGNIANLLVYP